MPNPTDWDDVTPAPVPAPKKKYHYFAEGIDWTSGQTFQQALAGQLPAALRGHTLAFNAKISISITVDEP